jgi:hypothetical protein
MDIKMLQKSSTFTSLSGVVTSAKKGNKPGGNFGSWFDRRARKLSMKCSRSITLGKLDDEEGEVVLGKMGFFSVVFCVSCILPS